MLGTIWNKGYTFLLSYEVSDDASILMLRDALLFAFVPVRVPEAAGADPLLLGYALLHLASLVGQYHNRYRKKREM
jgi:hypothetical protein